MKRIILIVLSLFFIACNNEKIKENKSVVNTDKIIKCHDYTNMVLYDTVQKELVLDTLSSSGYEIPDFPILYIGKIKDSIKLEEDDVLISKYRCSELEEDFIDFKGRTVPKLKCKKPNDKNPISIFIDTTKTIGYDRYCSSVGIKSYPIFIENLSQDTLKFGIEDYILIKTQIKDSHSQWKDLDCEPEICEVMSGNYLPPNQIVITSLKRYYGTKDVKYRLKFEGLNKTFYSNEINGNFQPQSSASKSKLIEFIQ
ncbi:MAG: hypothetical protein CSA38_05115 [Flavobacteriales bacterium]|nr:MAG: hypothetical protein CSA38_05115 [Flavobacteriales bacterium]